MTVDKLKFIPKGHLIVMKTGAFSAQRIMRSPDENAAQTVLQMGIQFENAYSIEEKSERKVHELTFGQPYADSREVESAVLERFPPKPVPIEFSESFSADETVFSPKHRSPKTRK